MLAAAQQRHEPRPFGLAQFDRVKEGDYINAEDVLVVLDNTQAKAEFQILSEQYAVLRASEVRLLTELAGGTHMEMPPELSARQDDPYTRSIWVGQVKQFESRRAAIEGQRSLLQTAQ